jgi:hypothetical protein
MSPIRHAKSCAQNLSCEISSKASYRDRPRLETSGDKHFIAGREVVLVGTSKLGTIVRWADDRKRAGPLFGRHIPYHHSQRFLRVCKRCEAQYDGHTNSLTCGLCSAVERRERAKIRARSLPKRPSAHDHDVEMICQHCGKSTDHHRNTRKYCGDACRQAARRVRVVQTTGLKNLIRKERGG